MAKIHGEATQKSAIGPSQRVCSQEDPTKDTFNSRTQNPHPKSFIIVGLYWNNGKENGSYRDLKHYIGFQGNGGFLKSEVPFWGLL